MAARWARLLAGLWLFAAGIAVMVRAELGVSSWDVLHDAVRLHTPLTFGAAVIVVSVLVLVGSGALGVRPGPGTLANVVLVGAFTDAILRNGVLGGLPSANLPVRFAALLAGVAAIAFGTALYISARLGAGPRDSLMLAAAKRLRVSIGTARGLIEGGVLVAGALLGGTVGVGTAVFAVLIGPAIGIAFGVFRMEPPQRPVRRPAIAAATRLWRRRGGPRTAPDDRSGSRRFVTGDAVDAKIEQFLTHHHDAVMTTLKHDGTPHVARMGLALVDGSLWSSGTRTRVRTKHLRRDPRCTLFVWGGDRQEWLGLETEVGILDGADAPQLNLRLYRAITGRQPDDLDEYLAAMVDEKRLIYEFTVRHAYGQYSF
ncbi:MAG: pyridoxamine 5'-phosphate oxidase family protein [Euzebyales bacterium]|nr:pyridoxamine 5'-phosphate oxidase family protein [Euzebyales bacterium]